jgi:hypothetical protein
MNHSIKISALTKNRLLTLMQPQETYDGAIARLLDELARRGPTHPAKKSK